jgi:acyl carrier protein
LLIASAHPTLMADYGRLDELFGMDSIAIIELVVGIEKEFDIRIPPEYLTVEMFRNLNTIAEHIHTLIHGKENKNLIKQDK